MPVVAQGGNGVSCTDRMKYGFFIGCCVGLATGALFGGIGSLRSGLRGRELINESAKSMIASAGTFGVFMAVGSAIRC